MKKLALIILCILFIILASNAEGTTITGSFTPINNIHPPTVSNPYPSNGSTGIALNTTCHVTISDTGGDTMNISFYEYANGSWVLQQTNSTVSNGTYYWNYINSTSYSTLYRWKICTNDGSNWTNASYYFTTIASPSTPGGPGGGGGGPSGYILIEIMVLDAEKNPLPFQPVLLYQDDNFRDKKITNSDGIVKFILLSGEYIAKTTLGNVTKQITFTVDAKKDTKFTISFAEPDYFIWNISYEELVLFFTVASIIGGLAFFSRRKIMKKLKAIRREYFISFKKRS